MIVFGVVLAIAGGIVAWIEMNALSVGSQKYYLRGYGHYVPLCNGKPCASGEQPNPSPWLYAAGGVGKEGCQKLVQQFGDKVGAWDMTGNDCHIFAKDKINPNGYMNLKYEAAESNVGDTWRAYNTNMFGRLTGGVL